MSSSSSPLSVSTSGVSGTTVPTVAAPVTATTTTTNSSTAAIPSSSWTAARWSSPISSLLNLTGRDSVIELDNTVVSMSCTMYEELMAKLALYDQKDTDATHATHTMDKMERRLSEALKQVESLTTTVDDLKEALAKEERTRDTATHVADVLRVELRMAQEKLRTLELANSTLRFDLHCSKQAALRALYRRRPQRRPSTDDATQHVGNDGGHAVDPTNSDVDSGGGGDGGDDDDEDKPLGLFVKEQLEQLAQAIYHRDWTVASLKRSLSESRAKAKALKAERNDLRQRLDQQRTAMVVPAQSTLLENVNNIDVDMPPLISTEDNGGDDSNVDKARDDATDGDGDKSVPVAPDQDGSVETALAMYRQENAELQRQVVELQDRIGELCLQHERCETGLQDKVQRIEKDKAVLQQCLDSHEAMRANDERLRHAKLTEHATQTGALRDEQCKCVDSNTLEDAIYRHHASVNAMLKVRQLPLAHLYGELVLAIRDMAALEPEHFGSDDKWNAHTPLSTLQKLTTLYKSQLARHQEVVLECSRLVAAVIKQCTMIANLWPKDADPVEKEQLSPQDRASLEQRMQYACLCLDRTLRRVRDKKRDDDDIMLTAKESYHLETIKYNKLQAEYTELARGVIVAVRRIGLESDRNALESLNNDDLPPTTTLSKHLDRLTKCITDLQQDAIQIRQCLSKVNVEPVRLQLQEGRPLFCVISELVDDYLLQSLDKGVATSKAEFYEKYYQQFVATTARLFERCGLGNADYSSLQKLRAMTEELLRLQTLVNHHKSDNQ